MSAYFALARLAFKRQMAYRAANISGLMTNAFFGALRAYVLIALFNARNASEVAGYSLQAAVTYTGLTQAILAYVAIFGWWDMMRTIRTGEVASDLSRPLDYFWYWAAQDVGRAGAQLLTRGVTMMTAYALVYPIVFPPTLGHWVAFALSLVLALLVSFAWRFIVSLTAFWTQDAIGFGRLAWTIGMFCSGFIWPLAFLPDWLKTALQFTPFPSLINTPIEIYFGLPTGNALWLLLGLQVMWFVVLYFIARLMLTFGVRKLVVQGG